MKLAKEPIGENLCFIYNSSFTTGIFLDSSKVSKATPVYKKGPKLEYVNYRPISLLGNLDIIIEKLMHKLLIGLLNIKTILYKDNLDFKKNFLLHMQQLALLKISKRQ